MLPPAASGAGSLQATGIDSAGGALLAHVIAEAEAHGVAIHLTTSTSDNLPYYRRFGFEVTAEERLPRGVPLWAMDRPAP